MNRRVWPSIRIADLVSSGEAEIKTGPFGTQLKASDYVENGTPVINVRNIGFGGVRSDKLEFIAEETVDRLSSHLLRRNDIVFGRKGAVERHALIQHAQEKWFQGSDCLRLRLNSERITPRFLSYYLLTQGHQEWMKKQCSHGATMASLNQDIVGRIELPAPDLATQGRIASILSAYDDLVENNTRRITILEEMARRIYGEWFVRFRFPGHESVRMVESKLGSIPEGWRFSVVGEAASYISRGITPKYEEIADCLVINQKCIRNHRLSLAEARRQSKSVPADKVVRLGDVLINSTGVGTLGRVAQVLQEVENCTVDTHVSIVRPGEYCDPNYFGLTLLASQAHFEASGVGSTGQTELSRGRISETAFMLPPLDIQKTFGTIVGPLRQLAVVLQKKNQVLRATRDLLLPKLISGELDVSNLPEPAPAPA